MPKTSSSRDSRSLIWRGSSSSASCSARSPVSLHENSEPSDDDREREDRRPSFLSACDPSSAAECEWELDGWDERVRKGIFAGRREDCGEGMVKVGGGSCLCSSPICEMDVVFFWGGEGGGGKGLWILGCVWVGDGGPSGQSWGWITEAGR